MPIKLLTVTYEITDCHQCPSCKGRREPPRYIGKLNMVCTKLNMILHKSIGGSIPIPDNCPLEDVNKPTKS